MECANDNSIFLDEVRRVHEQFDALSARVTRLEEQRKGVSSDAISDIMLWIAIAYVASMLLPPLVQMWSGTRCADSR